MKSLLRLLLIPFLISCQPSSQLEVVTFNAGKEMQTSDKNAWEKRLPIIEEFFYKTKPDIIGMQEVNKGRLSDLIDALPAYDYIIPEITNTISNIDCVPIFFHKEKLTLLIKSHFWLSETNDISDLSELGEEEQSRLVNWLKLQNKESGHIFYTFNTHPMIMDDSTKCKNMALLLKKIKEIAGYAPVVLTGSLNMTSEDRPFRILNSNWERYISLENSLSLLNNSEHYKKGSYNQYSLDTSYITTDHILINSYFKVKKYKVYDIIQGDSFISDHFPVYTKLSFLFERRFREGTITDEPWRYQ